MVLAVITYKTGLTAGGEITVLIDSTMAYQGTETPSGTLDEALTAYPTGGTGVYTYLWTLESTSGVGTAYLTETTQAGVDINYGSLFSLTQEVTGVIRCTVTDSAGNSGYQLVDFLVIRDS